VRDLFVKTLLKNTLAKPTIVEAVIVTGLTPTEIKYIVTQKAMDKSLMTGVLPVNVTPIVV